MSAEKTPTAEHEWGNLRSYDLGGEEHRIDWCWKCGSLRHTRKVIHNPLLQRLNLVPWALRDVPDFVQYRAPSSAWSLEMPPCKTP